jgi:hypothetical protein
MIDPATGWFEMKEIPNKEAFTIASIVKQTWLTHYPWPTEVSFNRGKEFMGEFAHMVEKVYDIKRWPITTQNPQANSIIERIHQTILNIIFFCEFVRSFVRPSKILLLTLGNCMKNCAFSSLKNCMVFRLLKIVYFFGQHSAKLYTFFVFRRKYVATLIKCILLWR